MLRVEQIQLIQFKCYAQKTFHFQEQVVLLQGQNGVGKTSVLDAIYYLCFTKSYFALNDNLLTQDGKQGWRISATFSNPDRQQVTAILRETGKKEFSCNDTLYTKRTDHIGRFPCVMIAPDDIEWINGSGEVRRRFLDRMIAQTNPDYLQVLMRYNRSMTQRNALLKQWAEQGNINSDLLAVYDNELHQQGQQIYDIRKNVCAKFLPLVQELYASWTSNPEPVHLTYDSPLHQADMLELLRLNLSKDRILQRTTKGIHRDDISVNFNEKPFKQVASQGQRKSLLFAIKLAERQFIEQQTGIKPILLLDDLFEKLDAERMDKLIPTLLASGSQLIVTDTHQGRAQQAFKTHHHACEEIRIEMV